MIVDKIQSVRPFKFYMYFIQPSRQISSLEDVLQALPEVHVVHIDDLVKYDATIIAIADVQDYLKYKWSFPTIVLAHSDEGEALSKAWQQGALAGWIWNDLPTEMEKAIKKIDAQYKRNQDSRDLPSAADLQKRLLPNPIEIPNHQIETFFQPSAYLSGDWYDYWHLNEEEVLFYLADVSGHGVTSSLLTSWMAAFHGRAQTPEALIQKLNSMLVQENIEKHITMIAGVLNHRSHEIRWCSAGHYPPAIVLEPGLPTRILNTSSFPLGLTEELEIETHALTLSAKSRFIICSDGALEPFSGGLNEQFEQLVKQFELNEFRAPDHVADDIAILSICRIK